MNLENCDVASLERMLQKIEFTKEDRFYALGGLFEQKNPKTVQELMDYFMKNKEIFEYVLGYKEYLYISYSDFARKIKEKSENMELYSSRYQLYKSILRQDSAFFEEMAGILQKNPLYMSFLRSCDMYKFIYSLGYHYLLLYGSPPEPGAEKMEKEENRLKKNHEMMTAVPKYGEKYRIHLLQGDLIYGKSTQKENLSEEEMEEANEIPVILVSAAEKTGSLIMKKERTKMPILDTGSVIGIRTGGLGGAAENGMETQISCLELSSGQIYYL